MPYPYSSYDNSYLPSGSFNSLLLGSYSGGSYSRPYAPFYTPLKLGTISESSERSPGFSRRLKNYTSTYQKRMPVLRQARPPVFHTENIDVTSPRSPVLGERKEIEREERFGSIRRGRTVIRMETMHQKENPELMKANALKNKTVGERLKEKHLLGSVKKRKGSRKKSIVAPILTSTEIVPTVDYDEYYKIPKRLENEIENENLNIDVNLNVKIAEKSENKGENLEENVTIKLNKISELPEKVCDIVKEMESLELNSERRLSAVEYNFKLNPLKDSDFTLKNSENSQNSEEIDKFTEEDEDIYGPPLKYYYRREPENPDDFWTKNQELKRRPTVKIYENYDNSTDNFENSSVKSEHNSPSLSPSILNTISEQNESFEAEEPPESPFDFWGKVSKNRTSFRPAKVEDKKDIEKDANNDIFKKYETKKENSDRVIDFRENLAKNRTSFRPIDVENKKEIEKDALVTIEKNDTKKEDDREIYDFWGNLTKNRSSFRPIKVGDTKEVERDEKATVSKKDETKKRDEEEILDFLGNLSKNRTSSRTTKVEHEKEVDKNEEIAISKENETKEEEEVFDFWAQEKRASYHRFRRSRKSFYHPTSQMIQNSNVVNYQSLNSGDLNNFGNRSSNMSTDSGFQSLNSSNENLDKKKSGKLTRENLAWRKASASNELLKPPPLQKATISYLKKDEKNKKSYFSSMKKLEEENKANSTLKNVEKLTKETDVKIMSIDNLYKEKSVEGNKNNLSSEVEGEKLNEEKVEIFYRRSKIKKNTKKSVAQIRTEVETKCFDLSLKNAKISDIKAENEKLIKSPTSSIIEKKIDKESTKNAKISQEIDNNSKISVKNETLLTAINVEKSVENIQNDSKLPKDDLHMVKISKSETFSTIDISKNEHMSLESQNDLKIEKDLAPVNCEKGANLETDDLSLKLKNDEDESFEGATIRNPVIDRLKREEELRKSSSSSDGSLEDDSSSTATTPKSSLKVCNVNCHHKCEVFMPNLCGVNQKLLAEALSALKKGWSSESSSTVSGGGGSRRMPSPPLEEDDDDEDNEGKIKKIGSSNTSCPSKGRPKYRTYNLNDFSFLKVLGKGSFGKVLLAELKGTESYFAVKCLKKDVVLEDDDVECTMIERKVLLIGSKHPYLCHLLCTFQSESHLFFVMEYLNGGDLMFHIQHDGRFSEDRARFYGAEIVSGLKFLHKKGIIYRDLKLDNVLLDYEGHVRIADFGMCKLQMFLDRTADTFCGTPDYLAPEIIRGVRYNQCVDWWAFGVLLYEMLVGKSPFSGKDEEELFWSICNEPVHYPRFLSRESKRILELLLEKDGYRRLGSPGSIHGDIKHTTFFTGVDWELLERRELEPPFKPKLRDPLDVKYFDTAFTKEAPRLTPVDKHILRSMDQSQFDGFSYTNPHTTD